MASWPRGREATPPPNVLEVVGFSEILIFRRKIFGRLLLVKITLLHFIGKSLNFVPPPPTLQAPRRLWLSTLNEQSNQKTSTNFKEFDQFSRKTLIFKEFQVLLNRHFKLKHFSSTSRNFMNPVLYIDGDTILILTL